MTIDELLHEIEKSFDNVDKIQIRKMANAGVQQQCVNFCSVCPLCQFEKACTFFTKLANIGLPDFKEA